MRSCFDFCRRGSGPNPSTDANHRILDEVLPEIGEPSHLQRLLALHPEADPLLRLGALLTCDAVGAARVAERLRSMPTGIVSSPSSADRRRLARSIRGTCGS